jgi:hypothetical protein
LQQQLESDACLLACLLVVVVVVVNKISLKKQTVKNVRMKKYNRHFIISVYTFVCIKNGMTGHLTDTVFG